nr:unnamed protein product [Naegleria fowleri]
MATISGVIVTGSTGFIGRHLTRFLLEKNYLVIATSRSINSSLSLERPETDCNRLVHHFGCKMDQLDSLHDLFEHHKNDSQAVVHLAAMMDFHPLNSCSSNGTSLIERMRSVNIEGSKQIFKEFLNSPEKKVFIFASSQAAMGPSEGSIPMDETSRCHPVFEYGKSKLEAEKALEQMLDEYQKNPSQGPKHLYILRFTGVTGLGDRYAAFEMIQASSFGVNSVAYPGLWLSPVINWARWMIFGIQRASFLFASDTIDCMEQNNAYSSQKAISKLGYNPLTCEEAFIKSIKEHMQSGAIPHYETVRNVRKGLLVGSVISISFCVIGFLYLKNKGID